MNWYWHVKLILKSMASENVVVERRADFIKVILQKISVPRFIETRHFYIEVCKQYAILL